MACRQAGGNDAGDQVLPETARREQEQECLLCRRGAWRCLRHARAGSGSRRRTCRARRCQPRPSRPLPAASLRCERPGGRRSGGGAGSAGAGQRAGGPRWRPGPPGRPLPAHKSCWSLLSGNVRVPAPCKWRAVAAAPRATDGGEQAGPAPNPAVGMDRGVVIAPSWPPPAVQWRSMAVSMGRSELKAASSHPGSI